MPFFTGRRRRSRALSILKQQNKEAPLWPESSQRALFIVSRTSLISCDLFRPRQAQRAKSETFRSRACSRPSRERRIRLALRAAGALLNKRLMGIKKHVPRAFGLVGAEAN